MKILSGHAFRDENYWGFWFRVFGYGLCVTTMEPMFSERYKYRRTLRVFGVKIEALTP